MSVKCVFIVVITAKELSLCVVFILFDEIYRIIIVECDSITVIHLIQSCICNMFIDNLFAVLDNSYNAHMMT